MAGYITESERAAAERRGAIGDFLRRAASGEGLVKQGGPTVPKPKKTAIPQNQPLPQMAQSNAERANRYFGAVPTVDAATQEGWNVRPKQQIMPDVGMNVPKQGRQPIPVLGGDAFRYDTQGPEVAKYGAAIFSDSRYGASPEGFDADMANGQQAYARAAGAVNDAARTLPFGRTPEEQQAIEANVRGILSSVPQELADARRAAANRGDFGSVWNSYLSGPELSALDEQRRLERQASTIPYLSQSPAQYMAALTQRRSALGELKRRQEQSAKANELAMNQFNADRNYGIDVMNANTSRMKASQERGAFAVDPIKDLNDNILGYTRINKNTGAITVLSPEGQPVMNYSDNPADGAPNPGVQTGGMAPGAVVDGYRFIGGNPNDPNNWEKA